MCNQRGVNMSVSVYVQVLGAPLGVVDCTLPGCSPCCQAVCQVCHAQGSAEGTQGRSQGGMID